MPVSTMPIFGLLPNNSKANNKEIFMRYKVSFKPQSCHRHWWCHKWGLSVLVTFLLLWKKYQGQGNTWKLLLSSGFRGNFHSGESWQLVAGVAAGAESWELTSGSRMSKLLSKSSHSSSRLPLDGCTIIPPLTVPPKGDMFKFPRLSGGGISHSKLPSVLTNFNFQLVTF